MSLAILSTKGIMVDIETLSQSFNAVVVSIGAVKFNFTEGIIDSFKVNIDAKSAKAVGLRIDQPTLKWWSEQSQEARDGWMKNPKPIDIHDALNQFSEWWGTRKDLMFWGNGGFDSSVLASAYEACKIDRPWKYWNELALRTVYLMIGYDNRANREKDGTTYHDSLADATQQAKTLINLFT